jgi:type II secretory pathway pseudopilin PulG
MQGRKKRRAEAGFTLVEVTIASLLLVVSLSGLVVTTVYSRNLSESSRHLWHATNAASATLEEIRHQSVTNWSKVTQWDGVRCDYGIGDPVDPYAEKLAAVVTDDASVLDRPDGMWTAGATVPNFYFVEIHTGDSEDEFARTLDFQTYVADRAGLKNLSDQNTSSEPGGGEPDASKDASHLSTTPTNVVVNDGKGDHNLSFDLVNGSDKNLIVTTATVTSTTSTTIGHFEINDVVLYNNKGKASTTITANGVDQIMTTGLAPGAATFSIDSTKNSFSGEPVTLTLTFSDGSTASVTVTP